MKSHLLCLLLLISAANSVRAHNPEMRVEIIEDDFLRPIRINRYYVDPDGKKVLHGECHEYHWEVNLRIVVTYRDGVPRGRESGSFNHKHAKKDNAPRVR